MQNVCCTTFIVNIELNLLFSKSFYGWSGVILEFKAASDILVKGHLLKLFLQKNTLKTNFV